MANTVTVADVEARFRPLSQQEAVNAEAWLEDAWDMLVSKRVGLEDDIEGGDVSPTSVKRVMSAIVIRKLQNPDGKAEESIDDYSFKRDRGAASGDLYVKAGELDSLTPPSRRTRNSVRLVAYGES